MNITRKATLKIGSSQLNQNGFLASANAVEALADGRRYWVGVGIGKLVSAGTDVGLSSSARDCLDLLIEHASTQNALPSLKLVQIKPHQEASACVRHVMQLADEGDILFFFVDDTSGCHAVMQAVYVCTK